MALRDLPVLPMPTPVAMQPMPVIPQNYTNPGLSLMQLLAISKAFWKQSLAITFVVFAILSAYAVLKPKTYIATATLLVSYDINDPLGGKEFPLTLIGSYMATQIELLSSPVVLMPVVDRLKLYEDKELTSGILGDLDVHRVGAEHALEKNLTVEQGRYGSQIIYINYMAESPVQAAEIANTIAEIYTKREYQNAGKQADGPTDLYGEQLQELKDKVTKAQDQLSDFSKRTGLIGGEGQDDIEMQSLSSLEQRLLEARNARRKAEVMSGAKNANDSEILGSNVVQNLKSELNTELGKMAELRTTDGPKNPRVIELQLQIDATRRALADEINSYSGNASNELSNAQALEAKLEKAAKEQRDKVIAERQLKDQREKYQLELESAQTSYRKALDGYDQISRQASSSYNNVSLVSRATPPAKASGRRTRVNLALGAAAGLFFGLVWPLAFGLMNRRIRCGDDLERDYGIPVIVEFGAIAH